jgi:2-phospho-L-lactate guanylyltransferase
MTTAPAIWAVVPVKALDEAKQRLGGVLPVALRRRLMLVMLRDVLATLAQVEHLARVLIVTPDAEVATLAERRGALVLREERVNGHSAAALAGLVHAAGQGATRVVTLPADAPCMTPAEVATLLAASSHLATPSVAMVPARDGDGTNALVVAPPDAFAPSFGPGSFARHRAAAATQGLACRIVELAGIGLDIDEPRDLSALIAAKRGDPAYAFLSGPRSPAMSIEPSQS